jgi:hypothetical protein
MGKFPLLLFVVESPAAGLHIATCRGGEVEAST